MRFLSVSELTSQIKATLSCNFSNICVEGEIGSITKHQSGHFYFNLKDSNASIKCILFKGTRSKIKFELEANLNIRVEGNISVYESRGEYQIICSNITKSGIGDFALKYEQLKERLKEKGYFEQHFKKSIPSFPKKIALITSLSGAALHDMKFVAQKRWNLLEITIIDTLVQGIEAKNMIVDKIKLADTMGFDIIVIARGGGSLEDLWAFNEEIVAEAIFHAKTPIVSAIGHEVDFTLSDFVADLRAPTPSSCMEIILPDRFEWLLKLSDYLDNLNKIETNNLMRFSEIVESLKSKIAFYRFDYNRLKNELLEYDKALKNTKDRILSLKLESLNNLYITLDSAYKHLYPLKEHNLNYLREKLYIILLAFLKNKILLDVDSSSLDFATLSFLTNKENTLHNLKSMLEAKNPSNIYKKGFVQITKDNIVKSLDELNADDTIALSDGIITKDAKIL
ncbi:exodeoxyribonuclease VII large subunit [Helicobacter sp. 16-1353]|uniref:exodeoxyribonuclease VII large subunit n=1 Tax=Helicobacter sp. 16-1353 TaxID=2004996 RepID=UPI000DCE35EB|nr:exodeoxyribonuclease VII large subunit [Helicobacter sp. 16-1353]RAX51722.1 exodeoxyribonuclease VII large subunit [Helicobacter sp. 16-1353]